MARALYFYVDVTTPKCFFEELPKDTLVVGHYSAEEWNDQRNAWEKHDGISIYISVDVCPLFIFPPRSMPPTTLRPTRSLTPIPPRTGNLRQRPPRRIAARRVLGQIHLHSRRIGRPQAVLHAVVQQRARQLAVGVVAQRRHPPDPGRRHWRDQRARRRRQGQDPGPGHARQGPERPPE